MVPLKRADLYHRLGEDLEILLWGRKLCVPLRRACIEEKTH